MNDGYVNEMNIIKTKEKINSLKKEIDVINFFIGNSNEYDPLTQVANHSITIRKEQAEFELKILTRKEDNE